ncbi:MAG: GTP pyrophosphokinase family protein [Ruminococcus sp.]|nr:GTP pyrophosphokinase family protein [Ruminococcus sp.]
MSNIKKYVPDPVRDIRLLTSGDLSETQFFDMLEDKTQPIKEFFSYYKCAIMEIETKFRVLNEQFSLSGENNPIEFIQSRIKSYSSIFHKLEAKGLPITIETMDENLYDIAGVRVVCSFIDDIYRLADCFLRQDDIFLIQKKDYIAEPKENGYRSLHLIVAVPIFLENEKRLTKVEVQLRTIAMDFWASLEHKLRYKKELPQEKLDMLKVDLKSCADDSARWDRKMQEIREYLDE